jgi:CRP/FNR family transcriptional regulator, cyclic AMP receptor protein
VGKARVGYPLRVASDHCHVLVMDTELAEGLGGDRLRRAQRESVAVTMVIEEGPWDPHGVGDLVRGGIGLLVLTGLVVRRVGADGRYGAELLGPGDLLRPWQHQGEDATLPFHTTFRVTQRARVALLDRRFAARLSPYPEVSSALVGRAMQRSRTLAVDMAIAHYARVDQRLLRLLWHLADRWGRVTPAGVRVPVNVTHQMLADLVAARRPAVTTALRQLTREGRVERVDAGWLLHGEPPDDLYRAVVAAAADDSARGAVGLAPRVAVD